MTATALAELALTCKKSGTTSEAFRVDRCANGQQFKCLTVTDEFTKEGLAIDVDGRICSPRVIEVLAHLVSERGAPAFLRAPRFFSLSQSAGRRKRLC